MTTEQRRLLLVRTVNSSQLLLRSITIAIAALLHACGVQHEPSLPRFRVAYRRTSIDGLLLLGTSAPVRSLSVYMQVEQEDAGL